MNVQKEVTPFVAVIVDRSRLQRSYYSTVGDVVLLLNPEYLPHNLRMRVESPYEIPLAAKERIRDLCLSACRFSAQILAKGLLPGAAIFGLTAAFCYLSGQHLEPSTLSAFTHTMTGIAMGCARLLLSLISES